MAAGILVPVLYLFQRLLHDAWVLLCGHGIERIGHTRIEIIPLEPDQRLYLRREASPISYSFSLREGQIILNANTHILIQQGLGYRQVSIIGFGQVQVMIVLLAIASHLAHRRELCGQFLCFGFHWGREVGKSPLR